MSPEFLSVQDVLEIHALSINRYGGEDGIRDHGLLESALAQPQVTVGGKWAHDDTFTMAAAYLFHIVSNHPFLDGNKRTGLLSALVFLDLNGISIEGQSESLYEITMSVAKGLANKDKIAKVLARAAGLPLE